MDDHFYSTNKLYVAYPSLQLAGEGVCVAKNVQTEEACVVKIIKKKIYVVGELILWRRELSHPSIIPYYNVDTIFTTTFIYMPRYDSNLKSYLLNMDAFKSHLSEEKIKTIFLRLCDPVLFLHQHKIAHRDLKLENYLVRVKEDGNPEIVLSDFGFAYDWSCVKEKVDFFRIGSPIYMAPELLMLSVYDVWKPDIWALGVCLYLLVYGKFPFCSQYRAVLYEKIKKIDYSFPEDLDGECSFPINLDFFVNIIKKIFVVSIYRPSIEDVIKMVE
jgi:calcium/calmodulin-dependent protein kinase I